MVMTIDDKIIAFPRGSADDVILHFRDIPELVARWDDFCVYVINIYKYASQVGIDPAIAIAQSSHETDLFRSYWWRTRLNPAGLGITGDPAQNEQSRTFRNGEEAARAQLAHLQLYATGKITSPLTKEDDPRYNAYINAYGAKPRATTIRELSSSWATDIIYAEGIVRHGNKIFPLIEDSKPALVNGALQGTAQGNKLFVNGQLWTGQDDIIVNGILIHGQRQIVRVGPSPLNVRQYADTSSKILRELSSGSRFFAYGWTEGEKVNGENRWWIGSSYSRVWVGGTVDKP